MTRFYLVRHATHGLPDGALPGRTPGVPLSPEGVAQAERLAERFAAVRLDALYASPLDRTQATARAIAARQPAGLTVQTSEPLIEIEYGEWTGGFIPDLISGDPRWKPYNAFRSGSRAPGGEGILDIQSRAVPEVLRLRLTHGDNARVALVSHGDTIRGLLTYFLGMPSDFLMRLVIEPASVSVVDIGDWGPQIVCLNSTEGVPG